MATAPQTYSEEILSDDRNDTRECHFGRFGWKTREIVKEKDENRELAGRQGFEPRYRGPEPRVLPLDDLPVPAARDGMETPIIAG
jgi:hypothetical protein